MGEERWMASVNIFNLYVVLHNLLELTILYTARIIIDTPVILCQWLVYNMLQMCCKKEYLQQVQVA